MDMDTDTDTGEDTSDTDTDTGESLDDLMKEYGLDRKYGNPAEVFKAVAHQQKELADRDNQLLAFRTLVDNLRSDLGKAKSADDRFEGMSPEEREQAEWFMEMANKMGYIRKDDIEPINNSLTELQTERQVAAVADAIGSFDDLKDVAAIVRRTGESPKLGTNKRWDAMQAQASRFPGLKGLPAAEIIGILHELTKGQEKARPAVPPVSNGQKKSASTNTPGRSGGKMSIPSDYVNWSSDKQYDWLVKNGLVE